MSRFWERHQEAKPKTGAALLFMCGMMAGLACLVKTPWDAPLFDPGLNGGNLVRTIAIASPLAFLCAGVLIFLKPSLGYSLGLAAGLAALPWLIWTELTLNPWNSWVWLIQAYDQHDVTALLWLLRILAATLTTMATACALLRLLPARLLLRQTPVCRSSWPALVLGVVVVGVWFVHSITPYVVPGCTRGTQREFQILHLEKRGLRIQQTAVSADRDGRVYISLDDRRLFQYRFVRQELQVAMPYEHVLAFAQSPDLRKRHTATLRPPLRSWNTERWYVVLQGSKLLEFATEDQTSLPEEIANVLRDILQLPISEKQTFLARDVCLGYCYDPLAEMGYYSAFEEQAKLLRTR